MASQCASALVTIQNRLGLHARPATAFAEKAGAFQAHVRLRRDDDNEQPVDGKSVMQIMMLGATCGTPLRIEAEGPDADQAVSCLVELVNTGFNEE